MNPIMRHLLFFGLTSVLLCASPVINAQERPKNLMEVMESDWLLGTWETKDSEGDVSSHTFRWKIENAVMVKEYRENGQLRSHGIISLDPDSDTVLIHSYGNRRHSVGEMKIEKDRIIRTSQVRTRKRSPEEIEARVRSVVENRLASGEVEASGVPELERNARNYFSSSSSTNRYTYTRKGANQMVMVRASKNNAGQFVESDPVTLTRKTN